MLSRSLVRKRLFQLNHERLFNLGRWSKGESNDERVANDRKNCKRLTGIVLERQNM